MANWAPVRFVQTAAFFNSPSELLKRALPLPPQAVRDGGFVWSAVKPGALEWKALDDDVMGGVSQSTFSTKGAAATFSGTISTENNGGFAGCRTRALKPALDLSSYRGLKLRVRGDGKRYKLILRDDYAWNGIAWASSFDTTAGANEWQELDLAFDSFVPTLFARSVPGKTLDTRAINTFQLTLSKFEYDNELNPAFSDGPFRLELESIRAWS